MFIVDLQNSWKVAWPPMFSYVTVFDIMVMACTTSYSSSNRRESSEYQRRKSLKPYRLHASPFAVQSTNLPIVSRT